MDEEGSAMIIALMIMVVLTILGITATTTTEIELQIAGNERFHKIAFYNADAGIYTSPKVVRSVLETEEGQQPNFANVTYLDANANALFRQLMGYDTYDNAKDLRYTIGGHNVDVDVQRSGQMAIVGGGTEFGSGAEGVGVGAAGGVAILYTMDSLGSGPVSSQSNIGAVYRYIPGVAGGL
jgi:Tfp pilus assembly protein PilX